MTFINTDGMAFIGPGSEWFWTALEFVALSITFFAIYRQLRAARASNEFAEVRQVEAEFQSPRVTRLRLAMYEDLRERSISDGLPEAALDVLSWYDNLGYLIGSGHLNASWFHRSWGHPIQIEWWLLAPYIAEERRADPDEPDLHGEFERLAGLMRKLDTKQGRVLAFDEATDRSRYVEGYIRLLRTRLRFAEPDAADGLGAHGVEAISRP